MLTEWAADSDLKGESTTEVDKAIAAAVEKPKLTVLRIALGAEHRRVVQLTAWNGSPADRPIINLASAFL